MTRRPTCPRCRHRGFDHVAWTVSGKPLFQCQCGFQWGEGSDGGHYWAAAQSHPTQPVVVGWDVADYIGWELRIVGPRLEMTRETGGDEMTRTLSERNAIVIQWQHLPRRVAVDYLARQPEAPKRMTLPEAIAVGHDALKKCSGSWDMERHSEFQPYASTAIRRALFVVQWQFLPRHVAKRYLDRFPGTATRLPLDDAIGVGQIALVKAAEGWDETRGVQFQTYAFTACWRSIQDAAGRAGVIALPCRDNEPHPHQAAIDLARRPKAITSRTAIIAREEADPIPEDFGQVEAEILRLPERQRIVVECRLRGMRFREIAEQLGCRGQWCQQLYAQAVQAMKDRLVRYECTLYDEVV